MATITASLVKELRERTGAGMMECKKALVEANGDIDSAIDIMRKSGQAKAVKKAGREAAEGVIVVSLSQDQKSAAIMEVNCETDFVARESAFKAFAQEVCDLVISENINNIDALKEAKLSSGNTVEETRTELIAKIGENINVRRFQVFKAEGNDFIGTYLHGSAEATKIGVLTLLDKEEQELAKDLAMHIAAMSPEFLNPEDIPAERVQKEKEVFMSQEENSNKPQEIVEKIINGKINKFCNEISLLGQTFVKENTMTVGALLKSKGTKVKSFTKFLVGEGIERKETDFVADVMSQVNS